MNNPTENDPAGSLERMVRRLKPKTVKDYLVVVAFVMALLAWFRPMWKAGGTASPNSHETTPEAK
jgi:hypothetical protein